MQKDSRCKHLGSQSRGGTWTPPFINFSADFMAILWILFLADVLSEWVTVARLFRPVLLQASAALAVSVWCVLLGGARKHEGPAGWLQDRQTCAQRSLPGALPLQKPSISHRYHKSELKCKKYGSSGFFLFILNIIFHLRLSVYGKVRMGKIGFFCFFSPDLALFCSWVALSILVNGPFLGNCSQQGLFLNSVNSHLHPTRADTWHLALKTFLLWISIPFCGKQMAQRRKRLIRIRTNRGAWKYSKDITDNHLWRTLHHTKQESRQKSRWKATVPAA